MGYDEPIRIAAVAVNAEVARLHAEIFAAAAADAAGPAADPGVDEAHLADLAIGDLAADRNDLARRLVAERQRQTNRAVLQHEPPSAAQIEAPFPDMQVGVADAGRLDGDHDFIVAGRGVRRFGLFQRAAEVDELDSSSLGRSPQRMLPGTLADFLLRRAAAADRCARPRRGAALCARGLRMLLNPPWTVHRLDGQAFAIGAPARSGSTAAAARRTWRATQKANGHPAS